VDSANLAPNVERRARELLLDHLGVLLRGTQEPAGQAAVRALERLGPAGPSTVALARRAQPATAALLNGILAHAIELDDVTNESSLHPGVVVWPATLALVERANGTLADGLAAAVAGYEVVMRVGAALNAPATYARGFHPTGVAGAFGAAAAAAHVLGADPVVLNRALGLAASMASGSLAYLQNGSDGKRLNAGWAAHAGVVAAELALAGLTGPDDSVAGSYGALGAYSSRPEPSLLAPAPDGDPAMLEVAIKPYACCRYIHAAIDACLDLRAREGFDPDRIVSMNVSVLPGGAELISEPADAKRAPTGRVEAQFSVYHGAAVALVYGDAGPDKFAEPYLTDPAVRALARRISTSRDETLDARYPERWGCRLQVRTTDGQELEIVTDDPRGDRRRPLSEDELQARFLALAQPVIGAAAADLARDVLHAPGSTPLRELMQAAVPAG
jgi:2-methylcitrate dehydratase PrpD